MMSALLGLSPLTISDGASEREDPAQIALTPAQIRASRVVESLPRLPITGKPLEGAEAEALRKTAQSMAAMMRKFG